MNVSDEVPVAPSYVVYCSAHTAAATEHFFTSSLLLGINELLKAHKKQGSGSARVRHQCQSAVRHVDSCVFTRFNTFFLHSSPKDITSCGCAVLIIAGRHCIPIRYCYTLKTNKIYTLTNKTQN